jgi:membrane protease YdiL (CAAX protease family)
MTLLFKLLAPWFATGICWCVLKNGWLAILAYHVQILILSRESLSGLFQSIRGKNLLPALPAVLAGPLIYILLPFITKTDCSIWLAEHHLTGTGFLLMIPYFGILHPVLEQAHWAPLRQRTWLAHPLFAGYHMLVLASLLPAAWLAVCFVILTSTSILWKWIAERSGSLAAPVLSHILSDLVGCPRKTMTF